MDKDWFIENEMRRMAEERLAKKRARPGRPRRTGSIRLRLTYEEAGLLKRVGGTKTVKGSEGFREAIKAIANYLRRREAKHVKIDWPQKRKSFHIPYDAADMDLIRRWLATWAKGPNGDDPNFAGPPITELGLIVAVARLLDQDGEMKEPLPETPRGEMKE